MKLGNLPPQIWSQLLSYSYAIRNIFAKFEKVDVRTIAICKGFERKTIFAYPELRYLMKNRESLKIFTFNTDFKNYLDLKEVNVKIP